MYLETKGKRGGGEAAVGRLKRPRKFPPPSKSAAA